MVSLRERFDRELTFLARRLSPDAALGLSWTLSVAAIALGGWAFGELAESVIDREALATTDSPVTSWLADHRVGWLTALTAVGTHLGSFWFVLPLVAAVGLALPRPGWGRSRSVTFLMTATGGASLIVHVIKLAIARPRPVLPEVIATATGYAFPSGHTAQAFAGYLGVAYIVAHRLERRVWRIGVWAAAAVFAGFVGFTRLYLGVHWMTDVIGGAVIAGCGSLSW
jgi:membrane-associated phospholipid phosphatase